MPQRSVGTEADAVHGAPMHPQSRGQAVVGGVPGADGVLVGAGGEGSSRRAEGRVADGVAQADLVLLAGPELGIRQPCASPATAIGDGLAGRIGGDAQVRVLPPGGSQRLDTGAPGSVTYPQTRRPGNAVSCEAPSAATPTDPLRAGSPKALMTPVQPQCYCLARKGAVRAGGLCAAGTPVIRPREGKQQ